MTEVGAGKHYHYIEKKYQISSMCTVVNNVSYNTNFKEQNLLEKLLVPQLVKEFPTFQGTGWFVAVFTSICDWYLSCARLIQSTSSHLTLL